MEKGRWWTLFSLTFLTRTCVLLLHRMRSKFFEARCSRISGTLMHMFSFFIPLYNVIYQTPVVMHQSWHCLAAQVLGAKCALDESNKMERKLVLCITGYYVTSEKRKENKVGSLRSNGQKSR
ncbi:hypothetical protein BDU57DRAFT_331561 [Ampelomyces quisqualis]|uniref:Uncharacterized protein n=1 Tax=Ampelomyces quisqualis TaxID=50730 RepID=A0A6A5QHS3_AMPQU|nr:hypothetical protein BDU57DRAFT_331561 [Ampelomyces quisqualis]